ncbi:hypothetical protein [Klebsiella aerogenes]|uniref:hypothetical protein n=1 Tax=Klebsiella aerogenes TaxID=548 RepID=UPI001BCB0113|nr:hypothetical protein [Klebsiella aerogenes]
MKKIFNIKFIIFFVIVCVFFSIVLLLKNKIISIEFPRGTVLNFSCKAYGSIYINGYNLQYVEDYRFYNARNGYFAVSGKIFESGRFIGIIGLKTSFSYIYYNGMVTMRTNDSVIQVDNSISKDVLLDIIPGAFLNRDNIQLIALFKLGGGYRIDYNNYPTAYCY